MEIDIRLPSTSLAPYIKAYCIVESMDERINNVLPDTSIVMAFNYKGRVSSFTHSTFENLPSSTLSGLRKSLTQFNYSKEAANVLVLFREAGAAAFFKEPLHHIYEESIALDNFINSQQISGVMDELSGAEKNSERIHFVEQLLLSVLSTQQPDKLLSAALQTIHAAKGNIKIKDLARSLYISQDAFEKRFRRQVGTSPKQFAQLVRMKSITEGIAKHKLSDIALGAGFYDQPHFNKDFKLFTGQTPAEFYKHAQAMQINDFLQ